MSEEKNQLNKKNRLSIKGLDKIFGSMDELINDVETKPPSSHIEIPIDLIRSNPYQPRKIFADHEIEQLAQSILKNGVIQPVIVKKAIHGYELVAGERRTRAARLVNLTTIPAVIAEFSGQQMMEVALIENIQRVDLNVIEEAKAYRDLISNWNVTQEYISNQVGKSRSHITNTMRLLNLPVATQEDILKGKLTMGQVKPLLIFKEQPAVILEVAQKIIEQNLSSREVESLIKNYQANSQENFKNQENIKLFNDYQFAQELLIEKLGTKVNIGAKKIVINFIDEKDLNRILEIFGII